MRSLRKNKQTIYYALYEGKQETIDSNGLRTGQWKPSYSNPEELRINVSAARGVSQVEMFGIDTDYSRTMETCDMSCPLSETSVLWIGVPITEPFNYRISAVAKSLNSITYAIREVKNG